MKQSKSMMFSVILAIGFLIGIATAQAGTIGPKPFVATPLSSGTLYASPQGSGNICSKQSPCSIWTVTDKASSGSVVFLRGGTYAVSNTINFATVGSASAPVIFESYPDELAVLDGIQHPKGTNLAINVSGKFIVLRNIEVKNMPMQGFWIKGTDNVLDRVHAHHNGLSGIQVYSPYEDFPYNTYGSRNVIKNSTVHDNFDEGFIASAGFKNGRNADGISISSGANNRVENNLVYHNSDDGIDTWRSTDTYVGYNISYENGISDGDGNGIKAGGIAPSSGTTVERNLVHSNRATGIDYNTGANITIKNNTTWNNDIGYIFGSDTALSNNIITESKKYGSGIEISNSWQRTGNISFVNTDPTRGSFLKPSAGGGFEDIGALAQ